MGFNWIGRVLLVLLLFIAVDSFSQRSSCIITYVNKNAVGANNGTSWADAYNDLQLALNDPQALQIWVAEGVYVAQNMNSGRNTEGTSVFFIDGFGASGRVFGGFKGYETALGQRNPTTNLTVLGQVNSDQIKQSPIFSTSKSNDILFDGFHITTIDEGDTLGINSQAENVHLINCWVGSKLVDNSDQFLAKATNDNPLKSESIQSGSDFGGVADESFLDDNFSVFPTVTSSRITVNCNIPSNLEIVDYLGKIAKRVQINTSPITVDLSSMPKGLYILIVRNSQIGVNTTRIIVQ